MAPQTKKCISLNGVLHDMKDRPKQTRFKLFLNEARMNRNAGFVSSKEWPFSKRCEIVMRHKFCSGCQFLAVTLQSSKLDIPKLLSTFRAFSGKVLFGIHKMDFCFFHQFLRIAGDVVDQRTNSKI